MQLYTVKATSCGNEDYRQDPTQKMYGVEDLLARHLPADKIQETFRSWIEENDLGGGNLDISIVLAEVHNGCLKEAASISYNGRMWAPNCSFSKRKELVVEGDQLVPVSETADA